MFKKKENNMTYFFGGTAVGIAAGLLVGKLLSNPTIKAQSFEPEIPTKESVNKYSQDDNIHNPYFHKNIHSCHMRSRSASRYENKSHTEQSVSATSLTTLNNDFKGNINYHVSEEKYSTNVQKICCNNNNQLYNISIENNAGYNLSDEVFSSPKEEKEYNNFHFSNSKNAGQKRLCVAESNSNGLTNVDNKDSSKITNIESISNSNVKGILKDEKSINSGEVPKTSNNLPSNFHIDDSTVYNNIQNIKSSTTYPNILESDVENASYMATCNSILHFNGEEEERISRFTSFDDFYETDLISSTRQSNLSDT